MQRLLSRLSRQVRGEGYKADDVECKDGQYDMTLDKDFKITGKEKED